jgi:hypothetical protein
MERRYSGNVLDKLVRIYNKMVVENLEMTANGAFQADQMTSMGTAKQAFYDKFIAELDYIKELSKNQPVITVKFKPLFYSEKDGWIELGEQQETLKTFDLDKANCFIYKYKKSNEYKIEMLVINDVDVLLMPNFSNDEIIANIFGE